MPTFTRPWLEGYDFGSGRNKSLERAIFVQTKQLLEVANAYFDYDWEADSTPRIFTADHEYYYPPLAEARTIIQNTLKARRRYASEAYDCDDFALVMKAHFCEAAYTALDKREFPYAFGIIWSTHPAHAFNWMFTDDGRMRLIEPQDGSEIPRGRYTGFHLAMI